MATIKEPVTSIAALAAGLASAAMTALSGTCLMGLLLVADLGVLGLGSGVCALCPRRHVELLGVLGGKLALNIRFLKGLGRGSMEGAKHPSQRRVYDLPLLHALDQGPQPRDDGAED